MPGDRESALRDPSPEALAVACCKVRDGDVIRLDAVAARWRRWSMRPNGTPARCAITAALHWARTVQHDELRR
jgi:hypothetical protein